MYGVELYAAVRLAVVDEGLSHHEAGRRFGIDRRTVKKMLSYSAPPGYRRTKPVRRPKLDGFTGIVDAILVLFGAQIGRRSAWQRIDSLECWGVKRRRRTTPGYSHRCLEPGSPRSGWRRPARPSG